MPDNSYIAKVYHKLGGNELVVASGGTITLEPGAIIGGLTHTVGLGAQLFAARKLASAENYATGAIHLTTTGNPSLELTSTADQSAYIEWASAQVVGLKLPPIAMPDNVSSAAGLTIGLYGRSAGTATAADAISAFDVRCWLGVGDTEMGATHPDFSSTPSWKSISIASGDMTSGMLNITLVPQAHAGRAIRLYDMRMTYTRSS